MVLLSNDEMRLHTYTLATLSSSKASYIIPHSIVM